MASGEGQSNPSTSGDAGEDHNEDFGNEYGPPLPTQEELREMEHRRLVGEATNLMLNFAKDLNLVKYMSETAFQGVQAQWKATTTSPSKPDSKKQYSKKELEEEIDVRLARILGSQKQGKKHSRKRKKSTDFPGYLGSQSTFDKAKKHKKRAAVPSSSSSSDSSSESSEEERSKKRSKRHRHGKGKRKTRKSKSYRVDDSSTEDSSTDSSDSEDGHFYANKKNFYKANQYDFLEDKSKKVREFKEGVIEGDYNVFKRGFVYLRDNKLANLAGIEILRRVKVLDLSFNEFKGPGFEPLANCKALQQLYLAGNQITSLSGLPQLPNLEFLSVAQNKLKSLAMAPQPRLQVLAASKNKISTFKGFPHLPMLEHLRLEENPISEMQHVEAAAILLAGPTLKKFNDKDLPLEEQELARMYPAHTALCIRDGWEFCDVQEAFDSSMKFLTAQWAEKIPLGYTVEQALIEQPSEEDPCSCHFTFTKQSAELEDMEMTLCYQWFLGGRTPSNFALIQGATEEVYWPKHEDVGRCLKVECTPVLGETEYPPIFAVSFPVLPGSGCPKVMSLKVDGELKEGSVIKGHAEIAWCGGTPGKGIVSWLRRYDNRSPVVIVGAEELDYQLSVDDVGANLLLMYTPVTQEGVKGEPHFATTVVVQAAPPSISSVQILGDVEEGNTIKGAGTYFGGQEGSSKLDWLREDIESGQFKLVARGTLEYTLSQDDVGLRMMFMYTPVNFEGIHGDPVSAITGKVTLAPPKVTQLRIVGDIREGNKIAISAVVSGGVEGASRVQWFKTSIPDESLGDANLEAISTAKISKAFRIPLGAVGFYIAAKYTPVRSDGESGEPVLIYSEAPVEMLPPSLSFISITGDCVEGEILTASYGYVGGHEGSSQYSWYLHKNERDGGMPISESAGLLQYKITKEAVNWFISFKCVPVRDDGVIGEAGTVFGQESIRAGSPKLLSLRVIGDPIEGAELIVDKTYWGGMEGPSRTQWFRASPDGTQREIKGATGDGYTCQTEDLDAFLCVSYEPVRSDGARGPVVVSEPAGPVLAASPACRSLMLEGEPREGEILSFVADYRGGEKGVCMYEWIRLEMDGSEITLTAEESLTLTLEDVGCRIKLVFTPVRNDGVAGAPQIVLSDTVVDADPVGLSLVIPECCQDREVIPQKGYFGGIEGESDFTWFRLHRKLHGFDLPDDAEIIGYFNTYTPTLKDVGTYLAIRWIPTRHDGKEGRPFYACSSARVAAAPPSVSSVRIKEASPGNYIGEGVYYGGFEGESQLSWYRLRDDGSRILITGANAKSHLITNDDYTCSLIFGDTPSLRSHFSSLDSISEILGQRIELFSSSCLLLRLFWSLHVPVLDIEELVELSEDAMGRLVWLQDQSSWYLPFTFLLRLDWSHPPSVVMWSIRDAVAIFGVQEASLRTRAQEMVSEGHGECGGDCLQYTPVRQDGVSGKLMTSDPTNKILPEIPRIQKLVLTGKSVEGEVLTALEVMPKSEKQQHVWEKYKKEVRYHWSRSTVPGAIDSFELLPSQRGCSYKIRTEDIGYYIHCECVVTDVFDRSSTPVTVLSAVIAPGMPKVTKLEIEGQGYHTNTYTVRGSYSGGKEGQSTIQWFRAMAGSPDLIPIPGEVGRTYEANVDDVGYRLVAVYTPVREDGTEGAPVSSSTEPIAVDPEIAKEVKQKIELGVVKFEALRDRDRSPLKVPHQQGQGNLERRVLDVNRKRVKVMKPGSKTSFPSTEIRGSYAPPFHMEVFRSDPHRFKIVIDSDNEVDLMVQNRHLRDVIVLVVRGLAQRFNSTPLNLLLKM
ncbi:hypothetical protein L7F22_067316 [Adiantum nelumboides]|nr:hypothetical protein [Adiantum nelumboides]